MLDDILNVRLQTLGVVEHSFPVFMGGSSYNWKIYDVGGAVSISLLPLSVLNSVFDILYFGSHHLLMFRGGFMLMMFIVQRAQVRATVRSQKRF